MTTRFNRTQLSVTTGGTGALQFSAPGADYTDLSGWASANFGGNTPNSIPYLLAWSGGYEIGTGSWSSPNFTRQGIIENQNGTTAVQSIPVGAVFSVSPLIQAVMAVYPGGASVPPAAIGVGSMAAGPGSLAIGGSSVAIGQGASTPATGTSAIAIGNGATAGAPGAISIGGWAVEPGADNAISLGTNDALFANSFMAGKYPCCEFAVNWYGTTANATPTVIHPLLNDNVTSAPVIAQVGEMWYVALTVQATVFDGTNIPTSVMAMKFVFLAGEDGMKGSAATTTEFTFGGSTATASVAVSAAGQINVTCTGIAATTVNWRIRAQIIPTLDSTF